MSRVSDKRSRQLDKGMKTWDRDLTIPPWSADVRKNLRNESLTAFKG